MPQDLELIIAADRRAGTIVDAAKAERLDLLKIARDEQQAALEESSKRLSDLKASLADENASYKKSCKAKIDVDYAEKKIMLDEKYNKNKQLWLDKMFEAITKA